MGDLARGLKALSTSLIIYAVIGLIYAGAGMIEFNFPSPPAPPSDSNPLAWLGFIAGLIAYPFQLFFYLLGVMVTVASFSIIPSPWNLVFAIPVAILFFYGLFIVIMEIIDRISGAIPIPI